MFLLALAVKHIPSALPPLVLALLTGLNAAAVGLICLAAYKLTQMTAVDSITRLVLFASAAIGTCYTSAWLFPVLTVAGGIVTLLWDLDQVQNIVRMRKRVCASGKQPEQGAGTTLGEANPEEHGLPVLDNAGTSRPSDDIAWNVQDHGSDKDGEDDARQLGLTAQSASRLPTPPAETSTLHRRQVPNTDVSIPKNTVLVPNATPPPISINFHLSMRQSLFLVIAFIGILTAVLVVRATLPNPTKELEFFANLLVAGTILFGGGPVVIPLLQVRYVLVFHSNAQFSTVLGIHRHPWLGQHQGLLVWLCHPASIPRAELQLCCLPRSPHVSYMRCLI